MLCPEELVAIVTSLAISISEGRSIEEISLISSILVQLGDTLALIGIQKERLEDCLKSKEEKENR